MLPDFFDFTIGSSGFGFGGGNLPSDSEVLDSTGGDLPPIALVVSSDGWQFGSERVGWVP